MTAKVTWSRFVQIAVSHDEDGDNPYALDEGGTVWVYNWVGQRWEALADDRGHIRDEELT